MHTNVTLIRKILAIHCLENYRSDHLVKGSTFQVPKSIIKTVTLKKHGDMASYTLKFAKFI